MSRPPKRIPQILIRQYLAAACRPYQNFLPLSPRRRSHSSRRTTKTRLKTANFALVLCPPCQAASPSSPPSELKATPRSACASTRLAMSPMRDFIPQNFAASKDSVKAVLFAKMPSITSHTYGICSAFHLSSILPTPMRTTSFSPCACPSPPKNCSGL